MLKENKKIKPEIPGTIIKVLQKMEKAGYEAYIVGGCVRDLLLGKKPKDWDITTNAKPEEIMQIFPDSFYTNEFFTVGIKISKPRKAMPRGRLETRNPAKSLRSRGASSKRESQNAKRETINDKYENNLINKEIKEEVIEVTTYRKEARYSDKRHPDKVEYADNLEEDLARRDFTVNSIAVCANRSLAKFVDTQNKLGTKTQKHKNTKTRNKLNLNYQIVDLYNGKDDIKNKVIKCVGNPIDRFNEDALRMMRAVRLAAKLGFTIEEKTEKAIKKQARNLKYIAQERIKDELIKIILSPKPAEGIDNLHKLGLLQYIIPELEQGVGVSQNKHHVYSIYKHSLLALKNCPSKKVEVRLSSLLHDIAKPRTKRGEGDNATFYNHDHVGARISEKILRRLRFPVEVINKVCLLVNNHMFFYDPDDVGASSVRKLVRRVGAQNMKDLIDLRVADRLGSGVPKAKPYRLRHLEYMIDRVAQDAVSVKMLKINGDDLMKLLKIKPSPKIGAILDVLLAEVIEDARKNKKDYLSKRVKELNKEDIENLREMAKEKIEDKKIEEDKELKRRHWVK